MSPIVCSLLALAALLSAADGLCNKKTFGERTQYPVELAPLQIFSKMQNIRDECQGTYGNGFYRVGETITSCNNDPYGMAPVVYEAYPPALSPVLAVCIFCPLGGTLKVVEYCRSAHN